MDTIPELAPAIKLFACQAFIATCEQFGIYVPLNAVAAQTVVDVDGPNLQLYWWTGPPVRHHAEGRFYPLSDGGEMLLFYLDNQVGVRVPLVQKHRDTFIMSTDGLPQMSKPAVDPTMLTFMMGLQDSYGH